MAHENLEDLKSHFQFGENWAEFSQKINQVRINEATASLARLLGSDNLSDKTFLDIGCGSGLFSLAACLLNAEEVLSTDIDPNSVATTQSVLKTYADSKNFSCKEISVFDLNPKTDGQFDIVYSWGVLHHTGNMEKAIRQAAKMVKPTGKLIIALYRKTKLCSFWKIEKRFYTKSPKFIQSIMSYPFALFLLLGHLVKGRMPFNFLREYQEKRGMSFIHDVHDWLGGYPYESITPGEMRQFAQNLGMQVESEYTKPGGLGIFGSGCDEYVLIDANAKKRDSMGMNR